MEGGLLVQETRAGWENVRVLGQWHMSSHSTVQLLTIPTATSVQESSLTMSGSRGSSGAAEPGTAFPLPQVAQGLTGAGLDTHHKYGEKLTKSKIKPSPNKRTRRKSVLPLP